MSQARKDPFFEIIEGCVNADRKCQEQVYKQFYGKMLGVCLRYSKNRDEARDILQDGFIKVFTNVKNFSGTGSFEGWIRRIMVNTALDQIRKDKQLMQISDSEYIEENIEEEKEEQNELKEITKEEIMQAVQQLPVSYRTVFNMFVVDGFSHSEIAAELGITEGASKSNLSKARMHLKKILTKKSA